MKSKSPELAWDTAVMGMKLHIMRMGITHLWVDDHLCEELAVAEGEVEDEVVAILELQQALDVRHGLRLARVQVRIILI